MGNSGLRKIFYPGDIVENKYSSLYDLNVVDLDKREIPLSQYKDKVCLIVNVGSQHRDAPSELQELKQLQQHYGPLGFQVLAFPTNQFANEPGNYGQVKECYAKRYETSFPIFAKVEVNGEYTAPVYKYLKKNSSLYNFKLLNASAIKEDFCKFLVDREGNVVKFVDRFEKKEVLIQDIETQLTAPIKTPEIKTAQPAQK